MSTENPTPPPPEELTEQEKAALCAQCADILKLSVEQAAPPADLRESGPGIAEFESMIVVFEKTHSIAALHQIVDLTQNDAPNHPIREPARIAVELIGKKLKMLKRETHITPPKRKELDAQYQRLSRAVGIINNGKVDHNR